MENTDNQEKRRISVDELIERAGKRKVLQAVMDGFLPVSPNVTLRDAEDFSRSIDDMLKSAEERKAEINGIRESGDIYIASIRSPYKNMIYLTVMHNGKLDLTRNPEGLIDFESMDEEGLYGVNTLDDLLISTFSKSAIKQQKKKKGIKSNPRKKPTAGPKTPPSKIRYLIDPKLRDYLIAHQPFLSSKAFGAGSGRRVITLEDNQELQQCGLPKNILESADSRGYKLTLQSAIDFVIANKRKIQNARKQRLGRLVSDGRVSHVIRDYLSEIGASESMEKALEFLAYSSNVRHGYHYFSSPENRVPEVEVEEMFDVLRNLAVESSAHNQKRADRVERSLFKWIGIAKAARFVEQDERIRAVKPLFEEAKGTAAGRNPLLDEAYEGVRQLAINLMDNRFHYSAEELPFIANGLWLQGYFTKRKTGGEKRDARDREVHGVEGQFIQPVRHLMRHFKKYDVVLTQALDTALKDGKIPVDTKLENQNDDVQIGRVLYYALPKQQRDSVFYSDVRGMPFVEPGPSNAPSKQGSWLQRILQLYIGIKRESITKTIESFYRGR